MPFSDSPSSLECYVKRVIRSTEMPICCQIFPSYDTAVEQIAVIKQLLELYMVQEDEFAYGSSMIELAIALHRHGDSAQNNDK